MTLSTRQPMKLSCATGSQPLLQVQLFLRTMSEVCTLVAAFGRHACRESGADQ